MDHEIVDNFEEATHWIPTYDENAEGYEAITLNKPYRLYYDKYEQEEVIIDNDGMASTVYLAHNGQLIKMK
jgi:hypothetical protein